MDTTDIEKKSLEAHVELCAERYRLLELKLENLDDKVTQVNQGVDTLKDMFADMVTKRNDQIISWGTCAMAVMLGIIGWFTVEYLTKL